MSHISSGVEYALHCLLYLTDAPAGVGEASVRDLAELQGLSVDYVAKLFTKLHKAGLTVATEGARGDSRSRDPLTGSPCLTLCWLSMVRSRFLIAAKFARAAPSSGTPRPNGRPAARALFTL